MSLTRILLLASGIARLDGAPGITVNPLLIQLLCKIGQVGSKIFRETVIGSSHNDVYSPGAIA
jgi:hypothetical protein